MLARSEPGTTTSPSQGKGVSGDALHGPAEPLEGVEAVSQSHDAKERESTVLQPMGGSLDNKSFEKAMQMLHIINAAR